MPFNADRVRNSLSLLKEISSDSAWDNSKLTNLDDFSFAKKPDSTYISNKSFTEKFLSISENDVFKKDTSLNDSIILKYHQICADEPDRVTCARLLSFCCKELLEQHPFLTKEQETWSLVHALLRRRTEYVEVDEGELMEKILKSNYSESVIAECLFSQDGSLRELQDVVDWLQSICSVPDNILCPLSLGWESTLHCISTNTSSFASYVDELDPDAPGRDLKRLHDIDSQCDIQLIRNIFRLLRCGRLADAQALCIKSQHPWRAVLLDGWKLFHDPNHELSENENCDLLCTTGNLNRLLWKKLAWEVSTDSNLHAWERALYGILSSNFFAVVKLLNSWNDMLWLHLKVQIDIHVESEICRLVPPSCQLPENFWNQTLPLDTVFARVEDSCSSIDVFQKIQKYIIMNDIDELLSLFCSEIKIGIDANILRFMVHLTLFLHDLKFPLNSTQFEEIVLSYIDILIDNKDIPSTVVAFYVSKLPSELRHRTYARYLQKCCIQVHDTDMFFTEANRAGIDMDSVINSVVADMKVHCVEESETDDEALVRAMKWVVRDHDHLRLLHQSNAILRLLLVLNKMETAIKVYELIPRDAIDNVISMWSRLHPDDELPSYETFVIREHMCLRSLIMSQIRYFSWSSFYHQGKPDINDLPPIQQKATFNERIIYEHEVAQKRIKLDQWNRSLESSTNNVVQSMLEVLQFPDGGWLINVENESDEDFDLERSTQLQLLRNQYIPHLICALFTVLESTCRWKDCYRLCDIIVSPEWCIYQNCTTQQLKSYLTKFADIAVLCLKDNSDVFGFDSI